MGGALSERLAVEDVLYVTRTPAMAAEATRRNAPSTVST
jgi:hypothetical protein